MSWREWVVVAEAGDWVLVLAMSSLDHNDNEVAGCSVATATGGSEVAADAVDDGVIVSIARTVASTVRWRRGRMAPT